MKGRLETVIPRLRPLRYPPNYPEAGPTEKGVDVQLALAAVEGVLTQLCDVAIIFSHDSDLLPSPRRSPPGKQTQRRDRFLGESELQASPPTEARRLPPTPERV